MDIRAALAAAIGLTLLLVAAPRPAGAETWYESYHKAEEALDREDWGEAVGHLNAALEQMPSSGANVRTYGMRFIEYFPYLKLGIAYYHLGQPAAAVQAFETEERQGEVGTSRTASALLRTWRDRLAGQQATEDSGRADRAQTVLAENLARAQKLETERRYEDALAALAKVLAVAPDHAEAQQAHRRLLGVVGEQQRRHEEAERFARLVRQGRSELAAGRYSRAAATLGEALELRRDGEVQALLEQAQDRLRAELEGQDGAERQRLVARSLMRAAQLEDAGEIDQALTELQTALVLDPRSASARALEQRLIRAQAVAAESAARTTTVEELLAEAERLLAAGDHERALRTANRVLALEPANAAALRHITRAYARFSAALLAPDSAPPIILLDNQPPAAERPALAVVRTPELVLSGRVYDSTPVELRFLDGGNPAGESAIHARELQGLWITEFRWRHRLPAGTSALAVVAVDAQGNTATLDHPVEYAVPFVRSAWFPATIAAGLASLGGGLVMARARRRRQLVRGRFNPYVAGAPILEHARFFGRQQLLDYVLRRVGNNSIMLYGERRIGKTSFQHQLKRCLATLADPDHQFHPVFIDLQGITQDRFFATLAAEIFHELAPKLGIEPPPALAQAAYGYPELVKDLHRVLAALKSRTSKRVKLVLLIDEVDELNTYDPRVNQRLRSLFMRAFADSLVAVVSGVAIKKSWDREGSPWYNFFQEIEVQPLDEAEAHALIEAPVRGVFAFEAGVAGEIVRRTAGKPYLIQRLCSGLVDRMHQDHRRSITMADLETACRVEGL